VKFLSLFVLSLLSLNSLAIDTEIKGFVALNTLSYEKIEFKDATMKMGIGTIDLKFYFNHEDFGAKIKLDLDGKLSDSNNLYEEAMVSWRGVRNLKLSLGKGKLRFHQVSYGVNESSYIDGGSLLGTYHSFRDQDRKIMGEIAYGGYRKGYRNTFAIYADSAQPQTTTRNDAGYEVDSDNFLEYENEKEIDTRADYGLVNQFTIFPTRGLHFSLGALIRDREADYNKNYSFDFHGKFKSGNWELIWEYAYAYVSTHPNDLYSVEHQREQMAQYQTLYRLTEITKLQINLEAAFVRGQRFNSANIPGTTLGQTYRNNGVATANNNYKVDTGVLWKVAPRVNLKAGVLYERRYSWYDNKYNGFTYAWSLGSGVNFWF
jgi:hypothetical protein